jgi:hypothetical protein
MKSPDKYPAKEADRRFKRALQAALAMPPMENKDIKSDRPRAKRRDRPTSKPAKPAGDKA